MENMFRISENATPLVDFIKKTQKVINILKNNIAKNINSKVQKLGDTF